MEAYVGVNVCPHHLTDLDNFEEMLTRNLLILHVTFYGMSLFSRLLRYHLEQKTFGCL